MNIEEEIKRQYDEGVAKIHRVYDIFKDFFGEDKVDLQNMYTLQEVKDSLANDNIGDYISRLKLPFHGSKVNEIEAKTFNSLNSEDQESILETVNICTEVCAGDAEDALFILVWFPSVRITNENDRHVDIKDLYAKVHVSFTGTMVSTFSLNRATYTILHMSNNYMHSHVSSIPRSNYIYFQHPCTGNGPINYTMDSLNSTFDADLWNLFCLELAKYVTVESLTGVPYHKLETLGVSNMREIDSNNFEIQKTLPRVWTSLHNEAGTLVTSGLFKEFMLYAIASNKIEYGYSQGGYTLGMSYFNFAITVSNLFIEWYNKKYNECVESAHPLPTFRDLTSNGTILPCKVGGKKLYSDFSSALANSFLEDVGKHMCTFKGKDIKINISDLTELPKDYSYILHPSLIGFFAWRLMETINFEYGNKNREYASGNKATEGRRYL